MSPLSNDGVRTGELSHRIDNGNVYRHFEMPRQWDTIYVNSPAFWVFVS